MYPAKTVSKYHDVGIPLNHAFSLEPCPGHDGTLAPVGNVRHQAAVALGKGPDQLDCGLLKGGFSSGVAVYGARAPWCGHLLSFVQRTVVYLLLGAISNAPNAKPSHEKYNRNRPLKYHEKKKMADDCESGP